MSKRMHNSLVWSRRAQQHLDLLIGLGLMALGLFALGWNALEAQNKTIQALAAQRPPKAAPVASSNQATHWQTALDANNKPLSAFDAWRVSEHIAQGHCQMDTQTIECFGVQQPTLSLKNSQFEGLDVIKPSKGTAPAQTTTRPSEPSPIKHEGWVQTPEGKRYFNPRTQRWVK